MHFPKQAGFVAVLMVMTRIVAAVDPRICLGA